MSWNKYLGPPPRDGACWIQHVQRNLINAKKQISNEIKDLPPVIMLLIHARFELKSCGHLKLARTEDSK